MGLAELPRISNSDSNQFLLIAGPCAIEGEDMAMRIAEKVKNITDKLAIPYSMEIMQLFKSLHQKGMTLLMATHDYQMIVKFPGKIFKCEDGKVFEVIAKT